MADDPETDEEQWLRRALSARPEDIASRIALARLQPRIAALTSLREGAVFANSRADHLEALAKEFLALDATPDAIALLQASLRLDPNSGGACVHLARAWGSLGEKTRAEAMARRAAALGCSIEAAPLGSDGPTPTLSRHLFDQYANSFEAHLESLRYQVPGEIATLLNPYIVEVFTDGCVIDLGCGTGLMAPYLRPTAKTLTGIDISPGMLEQAKARNVYDTLIEADLATYLAETPERYDLAVAADVLVYLGDLEPLFAALAKTMAKGGLFAASVERHDGNGYILKDSRRYAHAISYIEALAFDHGFDFVHAREADLRLDRGVPVPGYVFLLRAERS